MVKHSAPRRGSLAYRPRARAAHPAGRIRSWPKLEAGPSLLAFAAYKAGMTTVCMIEGNPNSPLYGRERAVAATVLEAPPMLACGIRAYVRSHGNLQAMEVWAKKLPKDLHRLLTLPKKEGREEALSEIEKNLDRVSELRLLLCTQPRQGGVGKKKPELMESKVGGGTIAQQFDYAKNLLGKEVKVSDVFKEGQRVDVVSVTKGKGFAGPVKRFHIALLHHKSRKGRRKPGTLGPWHPARVLPTIPRAGQLGYHQRTEYGKLVLKVGSSGEEVTPKGGFKGYGVIKGDYLLLKGSVPGPVKCVAKLRHAMRAGEEPGPLQPRLTYVHV